MALLSLFMSRCLCVIELMSDSGAEFEYRFFDSRLCPPPLRYRCKSLLPVNDESFGLFMDAAMKFFQESKSVDKKCEPSQSILCNLTQALTDYPWHYHWNGLDSPQNQLEKRRKGMDDASHKERLTKVPCILLKRRANRHFLILISWLPTTTEDLLAFLLSSKNSLPERLPLHEHELTNLFFRPLRSIVKELDKKNIRLVWLSHDQPSVAPNSTLQKFKSFFNDSGIQYGAIEDLVTDAYKFYRCFQWFNPSNLIPCAKSHSSCSQPTQAVIRVDAKNTSYMAAIEIFPLGSDAAKFSVPAEMTFYPVCFDPVWDSFPAFQNGLFLLSWSALDKAALDILSNYSIIHMRCEVPCKEWLFDAMVFQIQPSCYCLRFISRSPSHSKESASPPKQLGVMKQMKFSPSSFTFLSLLDSPVAIKDLESGGTLDMATLASRLIAFERDLAVMANQTAQNACIMDEPSDWTSSRAMMDDVSENRSFDLFFEELYRSARDDTGFSENFIEALGRVPLNNDPNLCSFLLMRWTDREAQLTTSFQSRNFSLVEMTEVCHLQRWLGQLDFGDRMSQSSQRQALIFKEMQLRVLYLLQLTKGVQNPPKDQVHATLGDLSQRLSLFLAIHLDREEHFLSHLKRLLSSCCPFYRTALADLLQDENEVVEAPAPVQKYSPKQRVSCRLLRRLPSSPAQADPQHNADQMTRGRGSQPLSASRFSAAISKELEITRVHPTKKKRKPDSPKQRVDMNNGNLSLPMEKSNGSSRSQSQSQSQTTPPSQNLYTQNGFVVVFETPTKDRQPKNRLCRESAKLSLDGSDNAKSSPEEDIIIVETPRKRLRSRRRLAF